MRGRQPVAQIRKGNATDRGAVAQIPDSKIFIQTDRVVFQIVAVLKVSGRAAPILTRHKDTVFQLHMLNVIVAFTTRLYQFHTARLIIRSEGVRLIGRLINEIQLVIVRSVFLRVGLDGVRQRNQAAMTELDALQFGRIHTAARTCRAAIVAQHFVACSCRPEERAYNRRFRHGIKRGSNIHINGLVVRFTHGNIFNSRNEAACISGNAIRSRMASVRIRPDQNAHTNFKMGCSRRSQQDPFDTGFRYLSRTVIVIGNTALQDAVQRQAAIFDHGHLTQEINITVTGTGDACTGCRPDRMQRIMRNAVRRRDDSGIAYPLAVHDLAGIFVVHNPRTHTAACLPRFRQRLGRRTVNKFGTVAKTPALRAFCLVHPGRLLQHADKFGRIIPVKAVRNALNFSDDRFQRIRILFPDTVNRHKKRIAGIIILPGHRIGGRHTGFVCIVAALGTCAGSRIQEVSPTMPICSGYSIPVITDASQCERTALPGIKEFFHFLFVFARRPIHLGKRVESIMFPQDPVMLLMRHGNPDLSLLTREV